MVLCDHTQSVVAFKCAKKERKHFDKTSNSYQFKEFFLCTSQAMILLIASLPFCWISLFAGTSDQQTQHSVSWQSSNLVMTLVHQVQLFDVRLFVKRGNVSSSKWSLSMTWESPQEKVSYECFECWEIHIALMSLYFHWTPAAVYSKYCLCMRYGMKLVCGNCDRSTSKSVTVHSVMVWPYSSDNLKHSYFTPQTARVLVRRKYTHTHKNNLNDKTMALPLS